MIGHLTENSQLRGTLSSGASIEYEAGTGIDITDNVISNTITSFNDLSDVPTMPVLTTESDAFTYRGVDYTINIAKYGKIVEIEINTDDFKSLQYGSLIYTIYTVAEKYKPPFEWVFPLLSFGELVGTCWITPEGEIQMKFIKTSFGLFRMHLIYISSN